MPFPTQLPTEPMGVLTVLIIAIATVLIKAPFTAGIKKTAAQNTSDTRDQVLIDTFTGKISDLQKEMQEGFAERDARLDAFGVKYPVSLRFIRALRLENPSTRLPIPTEIEPDL